MITYVKKDLFESPAQVLVNTVNTVGVMGKGIAKRFKETYPEMFEQYQKYCEDKLLEVGKLWLYKSEHKWVLNFPTKKHWRSPSKLEYIEKGLQKFVETYQEKGITSISFPLLGCGNGGLDWESEVKPLMEKYLRQLPIEIFIHLNDSNSKPEHKEIKETKKWLQSMPESLSFYEVWDDLQSKILFDNLLSYKGDKWEVTLLDNEAKSNEQVPDTNPSIVFKLGTEEKFATFSQLHALWVYLKRIGFCHEFDMPDGLDEIGGLVLRLMNKLDYIEPVELAHNYTNDKDFVTGIRVIPYKAINTGSLGEGDIPNVVEKESGTV
ncbi:macro domain-containing protein [Bacillus sp. EB01]|uniref:macro domain-containing protein n=1 Tax=Bacillus sp. EB01 TaxID=1347086 RepID=UPI0006948870|nr:macro domain-containing protein [Bacillus sp. EB01]